jgi:hypothetical protein
MGIKKLSCLLAMFALVSCAPPHQLIRVTPADGDITGIQSALESTKTADVVLVHGMQGDPVPIGDDDGRLYVSELRGAAGTVLTFAIV